MTQWGTLAPTIFNGVVDAVVCHWEYLVEDIAGVQDGRGREVQHRGAFFYVDDGLVASTDPEWLQGVFDTLTRLFDRVVLWNNVCKTVGVVCHPFQAEITQSELVYKWWMTGEEITYQ